VLDLSANMTPRAKGKALFVLRSKGVTVTEREQPYMHPRRNSGASRPFAGYKSLLRNMLGFDATLG
jgi:hypothetical protein